MNLYRKINIETLFIEDVLLDKIRILLNKNTL